MYFIANPEGVEEYDEEDDGVLISIVYDGPREQTYLLVIDAKQLLNDSKGNLRTALISVKDN